MYPMKYARAFETMMREMPSSKHYDSGMEGVLPECRSCRLHRPFWKYQSCVFKSCPYSPVSATTGIVAVK